MTAPIDAELVEELWREEGAKIWRSVAAYAGDPDTASDAVAEAFAQALLRASEIREPLPWLWRTSFRLATKELRRRRNQTELTSAGAYDMPEPVVEALRALRRLPPKERAAVVLHDYGDRPTCEIAEILGITPATVRSHLSHARRHLREILGEDDGA